MNMTGQLVAKVNQDSGKTNVIIVSGIPGSGKTKCAEVLKKLLLNEQVKVTTFSMKSVQDKVKFATPKFI